jgi:hypothetical protein
MVVRQQSRSGVEALRSRGSPGWRGASPVREEVEHCGLGRGGGAGASEGNSFRWMVILEEEYFFKVTGAPGLEVVGCGAEEVLGVVI